MSGINVKNERELALMREAGRIVAEVLARVRETSRQRPIRS
jgi:Xaa-Pro aminopeptidase